MNTKLDRRGARRRMEVAAEAARILATEGQRNYRTAKEKAAARLGLSPRAALPSNAEVETELRTRQQLYGGTDHTDRLSDLRNAAVKAMQFFDRFRPKLVGPVLEGTADEHSRISLHLFCEAEEEVARFLMDRNLGFELETRRIRWHDGNYRDLELIVLEADGNTVELALLAGPAARQAPPSPIDGRPQRRAGVAEVRRLADGEE